MWFRQLKWLRVGFSLFYGTLIALLFLDFHNLFPPSLTALLLSPQFVPALLQSLQTAAFGAAGSIVILTLLFGRLYCSSLCPMGTVQDVVGFLARQKSKGHAFTYSRPHDLLRYTILALTILLLLAGSGLLVNLLDPFSNFGRIFTNLFRPLALLLSNGTALLLEQFGVYALPRVRWPVFVWASAAFSLATLLLVVWLAASRGRLYCNSICPVGALLGLLAKISLLGIGINRQNCTTCRACEKVCKAGCIDAGNKRVDTSRCVGCGNCLVVCPGESVRLENRWRQARLSRPEQGRREYLLNGGGLLVGVSGLSVVSEPTGRPIQSRPTTIPEQLTSPLSPPGSVSIAQFTATCTACHLCVSHCPTRVLVPSLFEFGLQGILQPRMYFGAGHCNYDCTLCMRICPSGAIKPLAEKKLTQIGIAKFIKENCVVHTDNNACGACAEHCPTRAVEMVDYPNLLNKKLKIPEMRPEYCIGCGGCEYACPTRPYKAIYVDGNPVHKLAKPPVVVKVEAKLDNNDDFPF